MASMDGFSLALQALAKGQLRGMPAPEQLAAFRVMFADAVRQGEDALAVQAIQCWSLAFKDAQGMKDQQVIESDKVNALIEMFLAVHEKYREYDSKRMDGALIEVFGHILDLWHPWMWDSSVKAFEFCAAVFAGTSTGSEYYKDWTDAMRLVGKRCTRKEEKGPMLTRIKEKVNIGAGLAYESFDEHALEQWIDRYAFLMHFPEEVLTALTVACVRKGGICRARAEAMRREVCRGLHYLQTPTALKRMLAGFVRQGVAFQRRMQNAFSSHMWGKPGSMAKDEPGKTNSFYGKIIIRYVSFEAVQVDVVLPEDIPAALQMDMGRRAEEHAHYFEMVMGKDVAVMIRVLLHDMAVQCIVHRGKEFEMLPIEGDGGDCAGR